MLIVVVFMMLVIPLLSGNTLLSHRAETSFMLADDWNQTGNATLQLDTGEWNQAGNATIQLETEPDIDELASVNFTFAQTIDDDILHYPDVGDIVTGGNVSGTETNDYTYMSEDDSNYWQVTAGNYMYFDIEACIASQVYISYSALSSFPTGKILYLYLYNPNGADLLVDSATGVGASDAVMDEDLVLIDNWMDYSNFGNHTFYFTSTQNHILAYYFHVCLYNDSSHYYESFAYNKGWGEVSFDGDCMEFISVGNSTNDLDGIYITFDPIEYDSIDYIEYGYQTNTTGVEYIYVYLLFAGSDPWKATAVSSTSYTTVKIHRDALNPEPETSEFNGFLFYVRQDTGVAACTRFDYLHIAKSNEFGWSHDGSTTEGFSSDYAGVVTITSNGDVFNFSSTTDSRAEYLYVDSTNTQACIDLDDYPFLMVDIDAVHDGDADGKVYYIRVYDSASNYYTITGSYDDATGAQYWNIKATGLSNLKAVRFYIDDSLDWFTVDTVQAYSIDNYTLTQSSVTTNDILYVNNGTLYSEIDSGYILLDRDPAFNTNEANHFNKSTSLGTSYLSFYYQSVWTSYTGETSGSFGGGNVTDLRIKLNATSNIINIKFYDFSTWYEIGQATIYIDTPAWVEIVEALLRFVIPWDEGILTGWFMLLGAIMIPGSTIFLVLNRHSMNRDKVLAFFLMFVLGWGLLLMGVL